MFLTGDSPGICFFPPGAVPIEMTQSVATVFIDVEFALRARSGVLATRRVDPELITRFNLFVLNGPDGNFIVFLPMKALWSRYI